MVQKLKIFNFVEALLIKYDRIRKNQEKALEFYKNDLFEYLLFGEEAESMTEGLDESQIQSAYTIEEAEQVTE